MEVTQYMEQSVRTNRSSTMSRISKQLQSVTNKMTEVRQTLIVFTALSMVFCGAVFGITMSANELTKDTVPSSDGILVNKDTNQPLRVASIDNNKPIHEMSIGELKKLQSVEYMDDENVMNVYKISGLRYNPDKLNEMIFITDHGYFGVDENGRFSTVVDSVEGQRRSLNQASNQHTNSCTFIRIGRHVGYWSPNGCNDDDGSSGATGSVDPLTYDPTKDLVFGNSIEVSGKTNEDKPDEISGDDFDIMKE